MAASDFERNKLRKQLLSDTPFPGGLDFSRPIIVARKATPVPVGMMIAAGWPFQSPQKRTVESLDNLPWIQVTPKERERFDRGEPLLIRLQAFGMRPERSSGGQVTDHIEKQIHNAFKVNVFVISECLRHLVQLRDGKNRRNWANRPAAANFIFDEELLPLPWPEHDHRTIEKHRRHLLDTAWRDGQRPKFLQCLYPSNNTLRGEIADRAKGFRGQRKDVIAEEIRFLKTQFVSLNMCRERAREFRRIENEISESMRRDPDAEGFLDPKQAEVAAGFNHPIDAGAVFPAVYAGNFDPKLIFHHLASLNGFDFIRDIGRIARKQSIPVSPAQLTKQIERNRQHLKEHPEMFNERLHPELMSGWEFLLYAYKICEGECKKHPSR
jgi:hypothetical protein